MPHSINKDYVVLEVGGELWAVRSEGPYSDLQFRGPFRNGAEIIAWINDCFGGTQLASSQKHWPNTPAIRPERSI